MISNLAPYPAYRDSGVPWLEEVPEHWEVRRLGQVGALFKGSGGSKEDVVPEGVPCIRYGQLYTTYNYFIERPRSFVSVERAEAYTPIQYGDVLFAGSGETIDEIGKSAVNLLTEDARCGGDVIVFRPSIDVDSRFLGYATDCRPTAAQKATMGRGITVMHVYSDELKRLAIPLPPPEEQAAIVRFLDYADGRIRRYVRAKQRLIALLEEQKQAIIHRAVTRGLDPDVRLKPSGVEWLGDIPEHWEARRLKHLYREVDERSTSGAEELLSVSHLTGVTPRSDKSITMFMAESYVGHKLCRPDDLVVNTMWAWMGALGVSARTGIVSPSYAVYRPILTAELLPAFAEKVLRTQQYVDQYRIRSTGITSSRLRLYPDAFLRIPLLLPPPGQQTAILAEIADATHAIQTSIEAASHEIELLRQYRTRLIADVVTGKLDVREAAARLPEETDEPKPLDDLDLPDDALDDLDADEVEADLAEAVT